MFARLSKDVICLGLSKMNIRTLRYEQTTCGLNYIIKVQSTKSAASQSLATLKSGETGL